MNYYENNASQYVKDTFGCDMSALYELFERHVKRKGTLLDIGFGSGRDLTYFKKNGYQVSGIDVTPTFVRMITNVGFDVKEQRVEDLDEAKKYDGIWTCASLLHVKREDLEDVLLRCKNALKSGGVMYFSFKYGDKEAVDDNGRYFNYINEMIITDLCTKLGFRLLDIKVTFDVREDRKDEAWINAVVAK